MHDIPSNNRSDYYKAYRQKYEHLIKRVNCTFTRSEYRTMSRHASKAGVQITPYVKKAALAYVKQEYIVAEDQKEDLRQVILLIRGIGNNLNQLAARANTLKKTTVFDLIKTKKNLNKLEDIIADFVSNPPKQTQRNDSEIDEQKNGKFRTAP